MDGINQTSPQISGQNLSEAKNEQSLVSGKSLKDLQVNLIERPELIHQDQLQSQIGFDINEIPGPGSKAINALSTQYPNPTSCATVSIQNAVKLYFPNSTIKETKPSKIQGEAIKALKTKNPFKKLFNSISADAVAKLFIEKGYINKIPLSTERDQFKRNMQELEKEFFKPNRMLTVTKYPMPFNSRPLHDVVFVPAKNPTDDCYAIELDPQPIPGIAKAKTPLSKQEFIKRVQESTYTYLYEATGN
ncbi:MAG: hypothetical protein HRT47_13700 [Candidatus Caenarcaniphilales bacterium]|nr:hypothetical protein [Candidatus Caenarcaniphilales bacterium]